MKKDDRLLKTARLGFYVIDSKFLTTLKVAKTQIVYSLKKVILLYQVYAFRSASPNMKGNKYKS